MYVRTKGVLPEDVVHPQHVIQFDDQFLVCHGWRSDRLRRVCVVDNCGRVTRSYGGSRGSAEGQLWDPHRLAVNIEENILVADSGNNRILMLSSDRTDVAEPVLRRDDSGWTWRLCVPQRRIYVVDGGLKNVMVFE